MKDIRDSGRDSVVDEAAMLRQMAERMRRDGRPATAILLDNAAFVLGGGELSEYEWSTRRDGRTDDVEVKS